MGRLWHLIGGARFKQSKIVIGAGGNIGSADVRPGYRLQIRNVRHFALNQSQLMSQCRA
jgi:hypothetical protein